MLRQSCIDIICFGTKTGVVSRFSSPICVSGNIRFVTRELLSGRNQILFTSNMAFFGITSLGPQSVFAASYKRAYTVALFTLDGKFAKSANVSTILVCTALHVNTTQNSERLSRKLLARSALPVMKTYVVLKGGSMQYGISIHHGVACRC